MNPRGSSPTSAWKNAQLSSPRASIARCAVFTIPAGELDLQAIYDIVGEKIREVFDAQVVDISVYDEKSDLFHFTYSIERGVRFFDEHMAPGGFRKYVLEMRENSLAAARTTGGAVCRSPGRRRFDVWMASARVSLVSLVSLVARSSSGGWIRTTVVGTKNRSPAVGRRPKTCETLKQAPPLCNS